MLNTRISVQAVARNALAQMRRATEKILVTQEQLATARRINRPSDAPLDAAHAQRLHAHQARIAQYHRNLDHAQAELRFAADTLLETANIFVQARQIAVQGANADVTPAIRRTLAVEVDALLDSLADRANATFNGRYIFAGTANDARPYDVQRGPNGIESATYRGDPNDIEVPISSRVTLRVNEPGSAVFDGPRPSDTGAFDALIELRDLLRNDAGLPETTVQRQLSDSIGGITEAHDRVVEATARLGWRAAQVEISRVGLENADLANAGLLSTLEDADFAEAAGKLFIQETALQAAMIIAQRMLGHSLLEYLQ